MRISSTEPTDRCSGVEDRSATVTVVGGSVEPAPWRGLDVVVVAADDATANGGDDTTNPAGACAGADGAGGVEVRARAVATGERPSRSWAPARGDAAAPPSHAGTGEGDAGEADALALTGTGGGASSAPADGARSTAGSSQPQVDATRTPARWQDLDVTDGNLSGWRGDAQRWWRGHDHVVLPPTVRLVSGAPSLGHVPPGRRAG